MAQEYTVQFFNELDGTDDYGNVTYSVRFEGEQDSALWRVNPSKTNISTGLKVYGHLEEKTSKSGKSYKVFKRDQQEGQSSGSPSRQNAPQGRSKDNDGMRQGMCINNAAHYVAECYPELSPEEYRLKVESYANQLYKIDLAKPREEQVADFMNDIDLKDL